MSFFAGAVVGKAVLNTSNWMKGVKTLKSSSKSVTGVSNKLKTGFKIAGAAVVAGLSASIAKADQFQKEFKNVSTLVDESQVDMGAMKQSLIDVSGELGSATDLTRGLYQAISASVDPAKAIEFVGTSAKFAKAALVDTNTAVDVITTGLNAYGLEAKEASNISDKLFTVIRQGKTTGQELSAVIGQSIPLAANLGLSFDELGASIAIMTRQGIKASEATTQFNAVTQSFLKPSEKLQAVLKKIGFESGSVAIKQLGLVGALKKLMGATDGSNEELAEMFNNTRALRGVMALTGEGASAFDEILKEMQGSSGATNEAFEKQEITFDTLKNTVEKLMITVGQRLLPVVYDITISITEFTEGLTENNIVMSLLDLTAQTLKVSLQVILGVINALTGDISKAAREQRILNENVKATGVILKETAKSVDEWKKKISEAFFVGNKKELSLKEARIELKKLEDQIEQNQTTMANLRKATVKTAGQLNIYGTISANTVASEQERVDLLEKEKDALNKNIAMRDLLIDNIEKLKGKNKESAQVNFEIVQEWIQLQKSQTQIAIEEVNARAEKFRAGGVAEVEVNRWAAAEIKKIKDQKALETQERILEEKKAEEDKYKAIVKAAKDASEKAKQASEDAKQKLIDDATETGSAVAGHLGSVFIALGESIADSSKDAWTAVKEAGKNAIAAVLEALGQQAAIQSAIAFASLNIPGGIAFASASAAAFVAAGVVKALEKGGVGEGMTLVGEKGPELVNFETPARVFNARETNNILDRGDGPGRKVNIEINFTGNIGSDVDMDRASFILQRRLASAMKSI